MNILSKHKAFNLFFLVILVLNILFIYTLTEYRTVSKPMIMASLIGFYISNVKTQSNTFILALIFALFGDIFLMFDSNEFFLIGLGSFLLMQILYAYNFYQDYSGDKRLFAKASTILLILGIAVLSYLWNGLGDLKIPVMIYTFAILLMVLTAIIRNKQLNGYHEIFYGVVLFLISDAFLGISKFGIPNPNFGIIVIVTYMIAKFLIVRGIVSRNE